MIEKLADYFFSEHESHSCVYTHAEEVLKLIEEAGMLPPWRLNEREDGHFTNVTRWEIEDEEK